jgi:hypothetical protein
MCKKCCVKKYAPTLTYSTKYKCNDHCKAMKDEHQKLIEAEVVVDGVDNNVDDSVDEMRLEVRLEHRFSYCLHHSKT